MADESTVINLKTYIEGLEQYRGFPLSGNSNWGRYNFAHHGPRRDQAFRLINVLRSHSLADIPQHNAIHISSQLSDLKQALDSVRDFNVDVGNAEQSAVSRDAYLGTCLDNFLAAAAQWLSVVTYLQDEPSGKVASWISKLADYENELAARRTNAKQQEEEIAKIIEAARQTATAVAASTFAKSFYDEAERMREIAVEWMFATVGMLIVTTVFTFAIWITSLTDPGTTAIVQFIGGKVAVFAVLLFGTLWCSKNYRALKHLEAVNRHRALSIHTFEAFAKSARDDATRDAVLLEATRAVFALAPTGYVDGRGDGESDTKVIEIAKTFTGKSSN